MPKLTDRRHRQTRSEIADAAIALFIEHGFDDVTMDQVANAAGVSRRTAYRHFPNKYDLVFDHLQRWLECFESVVAHRNPDEPTRDLCRRGILAVAALIQTTAPEVLAAWTVFRTHESLRGRTARAHDDWRAAYAALIAEDLGTTPSNQLRTQTIAGSLVAMTSALCGVWAVRQPDADMVELTREALEVIDPLWPAQCR